MLSFPLFHIRALHGGVLWLALTHRRQSYIPSMDIYQKERRKSEGGFCTGVIPFMERPGEID